MEKLRAQASAQQACAADTEAEVGARRRALRARQDEQRALQAEQRALQDEAEALTAAHSERVLKLSQVSPSGAGLITGT